MESNNESPNPSPSKRRHVDSTNEYDADYWAITQINVVKLCYKWVINNYSFNCQQVEERLKSPEFSSDVNKLKWSLSIFPAGVSLEFKDYVSVFLNLESEILKYPVKVEYKFYIVNDKGEEANEAVRESVFSMQNVHGIPNFVKQDYLKNKENKLLSNDRLTIMCRICMSTSDISNLNEMNALQLKISKYMLSDDLVSFFDNDKFSDVMITVPGKVFHAHKIILAARSPVFSAMFKHDVKENIQNTVDVPDISLEVMKEVLRYMYTEKVESLYSMAKDIIPAADKYAISGLKMMCEKALSDSLNNSNIIEMLLLADFHNAQYLKKQVMVYISLHSAEIIDKSNFKALENSHPHLTIEVFRTMISKQKI